MTLSGLPAGPVRTRSSCGLPSSTAFLAQNCSSYSVSGFRSRMKKCVSGVSNSKLHASVPGSRMRTMQVASGFHLASSSLPSCVGRRTDQAVSPPDSGASFGCAGPRESLPALGLQRFAGCDRTPCVPMARSGVFGAMGLHAVREQCKPAAGDVAHGAGERTCGIAPQIQFIGCSVAERFRMQNI